MTKDAKGKSPTRSLGKGDQILRNKRALAEKTAYIKRKEKALEREKDNYDIILFFRSRDDWWKIAGHSVLFYNKLIAPRLKKSPHIFPDSDYGTKSREGIISFSNMAATEKNLIELGLSPSSKNNDSFKAYKLQEKVTPEIFNVLVNEDKEKWEMASKLVMPGRKWPALKMGILELFRATHEGVKILNAPGRKEVGDDLISATVEISKAFSIAIRPMGEPLEQLLRMQELLNEYDGVMMIVTHMRLVAADKIYEMAEATRKLRELINREIKKENNATKRDGAEEQEENNAATSKAAAA